MLRVSDQWTAKAAWMREVRALKAVWSPDGQILELALEPSLPTQGDDSDTQQTTPQQPTPEEEQRERRRVALGAVGGLRYVPRDT